jgi:hypothetical protein
LLFGFFSVFFSISLSLSSWSIGVLVLPFLIKDRPKTEKNPNNKNLFTALNQKDHASKELYYKDKSERGTKIGFFSVFFSISLSLSSWSIGVLVLPFLIKDRPSNNQKDHASKELYYKDKSERGTKKVDPSNNNGEFTIGELSYDVIRRVYFFSSSFALIFVV